MRLISTRCSTDFFQPLLLFTLLLQGNCYQEFFSASKQTFTSRKKIFNSDALELTKIIIKPVYHEQKETMFRVFEKYPVYS